MTLISVLYALVAAAAAGGVGFIASGLVQGVFDLRDRPFWLAPGLAVVTLAVSVLLLWAPEEAGTTIRLDGPAPASGSPEEGADASDPIAMLVPLKSENPALYAQVRAAFDREMREGRGTPVAVARARDLLDTYIERKTPMLPDDIVIERFALMRDVMSYLSARNEDTLCTDIALGRQRTGVQHYLSTELIARDNANVGHIVAAVPDAGALRLTQPQFQMVANTAFARASETSGVKPEEIDNLLTGVGDPKKTCLLMVGFFGALVSLPTGDAGAALRAMAAGEQSATPAPVVETPAVPTPSPPSSN